MPISAIEGCSQAHWHEVKQILENSIKEAGFLTRLVSDADDSGVIQKRIIHNLYHNDIVVCDVSAKNPNVMFELGIRLAFNKPTVIVKDEDTTYSFDTSVIEHISYPRDLRYNSMIEFQRELTRKVKATYEKSSDPNYTTFLGHFGEFKVAEIHQKEVTVDKYIVNTISEIMKRMDLQDAALRQISKYIVDGEYKVQPKTWGEGRIGDKYSMETFVFPGVGKNSKFIGKMESVLNEKPGLFYEYSVDDSDVQLTLGNSKNHSDILIQLSNLYDNMT